MARVLVSVLLALARGERIRQQVAFGFVMTESPTIAAHGM